ncbi:MAG: CHAP domain-containing protein [Mogibacterium sp.]|nr:CHAP domain-containing protein [Mogibacterium sp.]
MLIVSAGAQDIYAGTNGHTQQDAVNWATARGNEKWCQDVDGANGCQCVDLILAYYKYLTGGTKSGNACDYRSNALPDGWKRVYSNPQAGDVVVWAPGVQMGWDPLHTEYANSSFGHIGIVWRVNSGGTISTIETNTLTGQAAAYKERYASTAACYIRPDFTTSGSPWYSGLGALNIGADFYAQMVLSSTWVAPSVNPSSWNVENGEKVTSDHIHSASYKAEHWHFIRNSDGSYQILNPYYDNRPLEAVGTTSGTNVKLGTSYTGAAKQKWLIYDPDSKGNGSYIIRNSASEFVLNVDSAKSETGTNLQIWRFTNSAAEQFNIYKHTAVGASTLSVTANTEASNTSFSWTKPSGEVKWYDLMVTKLNSSGGTEKTYNKTYLTSTSASISLPAGNYKAYVVSHSYFNSANSSTISFTVGSSDSQKPQIKNIKTIKCDVQEVIIEADVSDNDTLDKTRGYANVRYLMGDQFMVGPLVANLTWLSDTKIQVTVKRTTCETIEVRFYVYDTAGNESNASVVLERPSSKYYYAKEGDTFSSAEFTTSDLTAGWSDCSYYGDVLLYHGDGTYTALKAGKSTLYYVNKQYGTTFGIVIVVEKKECTHENTELQGYKAPTCTDNGYTGDTLCAECGKTVKKGFVLSATGHNWGDCTSVDSVSHIIRCVRCDEEAIEGHHFSISKVKKQATFGEDGEAEMDCKDCGYVKSSFIPGIGAIKLAKASFTYSGKAQKPGVSILDVDGNKIDPDMYEVVYPSGCINVGKYNVRVVFSDAYTGVKTLTYLINPKGTTLSKVTAGKKSFKAIWKKQATQTTGYQIQYGLKSNFKGAKTVTVKKNKTVKATVKKLKAKKKYYVRIRTYRTVAGKTYYSAWSKAKTVKTK